MMFMLLESKIMSAIESGYNSKIDITNKDMSLHIERTLKNEIFRCTIKLP